MPRRHIAQQLGLTRGLAWLAELQQCMVAGGVGLCFDEARSVEEEFGEGGDEGFVLAHFWVVGWVRC